MLSKRSRTLPHNALVPQEQNRIEVGSIIRSLFVLGELNKSVQGYVEEWLDLASKVSNLAKRDNRESILKQIFVMYDVDRNGVLDLQVRIRMKCTMMLYSVAQSFSTVNETGIQQPPASFEEERD